MTSRPTRRRFLQDTAAAACAAALPPSALAVASPQQPILDAHIHLFDPTRPGGVPWPEPSNTVLYRPALPTRYAALAKPEGVLGAIAIECSPLPSDNDWLLATAARSDLIVGVIGNLDPTLPTFPADLDRLVANRLFRGIRYGNLWGRNLAQHVDNAAFIANLKLLSKHGLVMDTASQTLPPVDALLRLTTQLPDLRLILDHLPQFPAPHSIDNFGDPYLNDLKRLSQNPNVFVKLSEIPRRIDGTVPFTLAPYKSWLDTIWDLFGEDRILFGSDWPNSDQLTPIHDVFTLARSYLATRTTVATRKVFWSNATRIYDLHLRTEAQRKANSMA